MGKKSKRMKRLRKAASPARAALMGALGGAIVMFLGRDRLRSGIAHMRERMQPGAQPAE